MLLQIRKAGVSQPPWIIALPSHIGLWPTPDFSLFPLHAANLLGKGQYHLPDLHVPPRSPTFDAPTQARTPDPSNAVAER